MSKSRNEICVCGYCGKQYPIEIYESINHTFNPELTQKILDGNIQHYICSHCGNINVVCTPLLWNYGILGIPMIWYFPWNKNINNYSGYLAYDYSDKVLNFKDFQNKVKESLNCLKNSGKTKLL